MVMLVKVNKFIIIIYYLITLNVGSVLQYFGPTTAVGRMYILCS